MTTLYGGRSLDELEALLSVPAASTTAGVAKAELVAAIPALIARIRELEAPRLPEIRCDKCDNGIEDAWLWCPFCNAVLKEEPSL